MFETSYLAGGYHQLPDTDEGDENDQLDGNMIPIYVPDRKDSRWSHLENPDDFFRRCYKYFQCGGFWVLVIDNVGNIIKWFITIIVADILLFNIKWSVLFSDKIGNSFRSGQEWWDNNPVWYLILSGLFMLGLVGRSLKRIYGGCEIKKFYESALNIQNRHLPDYTWHEVQMHILEAQKKHQMCINKTELSSLDLYHRVLRYDNYEVAMVNKHLLQIKIDVPLIGEICIYTKVLRYILRWILFWGPGSLFEHPSTLKDEVKDSSQQNPAAKRLRFNILIYTVIVLCLAVFYVIGWFFFSLLRHVQEFRLNPAKLSERQFSIYGQTYVRHYHELDHELEARLNRAYRPSIKYVSLFVDKATVSFVKVVRFLVGTVAFICLILLADDDLVFAELLAVSVGSYIVYSVLQGLIPDKYAVNAPHLLMRSITAHLHCVPDDWKNKAHTRKTYKEFCQFFQYKIVYVLEMLFAPLTTAYFLFFCLYPKADEVIKFFRSFTLYIDGVGDVCSFASLNIKAHGDPEWGGGDPETPVEDVENEDVEASMPPPPDRQGEGGKVELSMMHFMTTNPEWHLPDHCASFVQQLKDEVTRNTATGGFADVNNPLVASLHDVVNSGVGVGSFMPSVQFQSFMPSAQENIYRGPGMSLMEGPIRRGNKESLLKDVQTSIMEQSQAGQLNPALSNFASTIEQLVSEDRLEQNHVDMSFQTLYMHQRHHQMKHQPRSQGTSMLSLRQGRPRREPRMDLDLDQHAQTLMRGATANLQSETNLKPPAGSLQLMWNQPNTQQSDVRGSHNNSSQLPFMTTAMNLREEQEELYGENSQQYLELQGRNSSTDV